MTRGSTLVFLFGLLLVNITLLASLSGKIVDWMPDWLIQDRNRDEVRKAYRWTALAFIIIEVAVFLGAFDKH